MYKLETGLRIELSRPSPQFIDEIKDQSTARGGTLCITTSRSKTTSVDSAESKHYLISTEGDPEELKGDVEYPSGTVLVIP